MITNYHLLRRWVESTKAEIIGSKIVEIFSQQKNILVLGLVTPQRKTSAIEIECDGPRSSMVLRPSYSRKNKNSVSLFPAFVGGKIEEFYIHEEDRFIFLKSNGAYLVFQFFGSVNVIQTNERFIVSDAFQNSRILTGQTLHTEKKNSWIIDETSFVQQFPTREVFIQAVAGGFGQLNKILSLELLRTISDETTSYYAHYREVFHRLHSELVRIYHVGEIPKLLAPMHLESYTLKNPDLKETVFDAVNDAFLEYIHLRKKIEFQSSKADQIKKALARKIKKNKTLIDSLVEERANAQNHKSFEEKAHILNSFLNRIQKGMETITLPDLYQEEKEIAISLDDSLSPHENVQRYFSKAKKLKASVSKIEDRVHQLEAEWLSYVALQKQLDEKFDLKFCEKLYAEFVKKGWIQEKQESQNYHEPEIPSFREFTVSGNWKVFVGQNDEKNDALTFRFAKKDDYWFHARGVPGSHVVLRREGRKDNPPKNVIESTASIAAFFSKAKTSGLASVSYTLCKFVRKPRGAKPGSVFLEREDVILVEPKDPTT